MPVGARLGFVNYPCYEATRNLRVKIRILTCSYQIRVRVRGGPTKEQVEKYGF